MDSSSALKERIQSHDPGLALEFQPPCRILGRFSPGSEAPDRVDAFCDGRHWARVPVAWDSHAFALDLPNASKALPVDVEIRAIDGALLGAMTTDVLPRLNAYGLDAASVCAAYDLPLFSVPWMSFDGARIVVSGSHLPPAGDPGQLSVRFGPGVVFEFAYPLPSPEFANHFWYWPNAHLSNFQLTIDLPASAAGSDPFTFEFVYSHERPSSHEPVEAHRVGRRVYIPSRLGSAICFPRDTTQLTRVQTWSNDQSVTFTGFNVYKTIQALLARHNVRPRPGLNILDWGCGHGRVTRHFIQNWPGAKVFGADVDRENVEWCTAHLAGDFRILPLQPPTTLPEASFDAIFGISVMTHLTAENQAAWLDEIARLLKPGGIALISFSGFAAAAFSSVFRSPDWWERWVETGFDDQQHDPALDGKIEDGAYYRDTLQSPSYTRRAWADPLEIVDIYPSAVGYQDVAVLRRRDDAKRGSDAKRRRA